MVRHNDYVVIGTQRHRIANKGQKNPMSLVELYKIKPISVISDSMKIRYSALYHKCVLCPHITP